MGYSFGITNGLQTINAKRIVIGRERLSTILRLPRCRSEPHKLLVDAKSQIFHSRNNRKSVAPKGWRREKKRGIFPNGQWQVDLEMRRQPPLEEKRWHASFLSMIEWQCLLGTPSTSPKRLDEKVDFVPRITAVCHKWYSSHRSTIKISRKFPENSNAEPKWISKNSSTTHSSTPAMTLCFWTKLWRISFPRNQCQGMF